MNSQKTVRCMGQARARISVLDCDELQQEITSLVDLRDNEAIIGFLDSPSSNIKKNFNFVVLKLTVLNDPETLHSILSWGKKKSLTPAAGGEACLDEHNPILVSCQQDFKTCMEHLYQHGYRMGKFDSKYKADEDDQVKKFIRFQAACNIHYLSLEFIEHQALQTQEKVTELKSQDMESLQEIDPIRNVFKMMKDADHKMSGFQGSNELKCNYIAIKTELEDFIHGILTQCNDMKAVKTILDHNPEDDDDDELDDAEPNWKMALFEGKKYVVSHPNFQQYIWRKMTGDGSVNEQIPFGSLVDKIPNLKPVTKISLERALWNMKNIPLTILTCLLCYPFVVIIDLFRKSDILFVTPKALYERKLKNGENDIEKQPADRKESPKGYFDYFRQRMHIPMFRMIPYIFIQVVYLILLFLSVWNPADPVKAFSETNKRYISYMFMFVTFSIAVSFLVDDIIELFRPNHSQPFWSKLSLITHLLLVGGAVIATSSFYSEHHFFPAKSLADMSGQNAVNVGMVMLSYGAGMEFLLILRWLVLLESTGPMVLCILQASKDALRLVIIYIIFFVAHGIAFWALYKPFHHGSTNHTQNSTANYVLGEEANALKSKQGLFNTLYWRIFEPAGPEMVTIINTNSIHDQENDFSLEFSHLAGLALWAIYQIIICILLLNLLIAVMNTSYSELWQNSQREWKYSKSCLLAQFLEPLEIFPAPFRWLYYLAKAVYKCKKITNKESNKQDKLKYFCLLRRLILHKQEAEFEKSSEDKSNDLVKDIVNEVRKVK